LKKYQQLTIGLAVALVALYYTLRNVSLDEVVGSFKEMDHIYIIPAMLIIALGYVFRAYRWQALLEPTLKVNVSGLYSPMMVGFMGNFLPARAAEVLRPYLLAKKYNITFSAALASVVMERLFDLVMLLLIFVWVFWFEADVFSSNVEFSGFSVQTMAVKFGQVCLIAAGAFAVFIYGLLNHKEKLMRLVRWCTRRLPEKWAEKIEFLVEEFTLGCEVIRNFRTLTKVTLHSLLIWATNIFAFYPLYFAYDLQNKTIASLLILTVMISILITVVPTPGFLGSFNAGVLIALHGIMGEAELNAISLGMVMWALFAAAILVSGFYFVLHDHMSIKTLVEVERESESAIEQAEHPRKLD